VGRATDCFIELSGTERDQSISRHHCRLDINPPALQVQDLGSTNGTYLNGKEVGPAPKELCEKISLFVEHGDLLTVGGTTLRVDIVDCPHAGRDAGENSGWGMGETAKKDCSLPC
jgi:hypothetical protein